MIASFDHETKREVTDTVQYTLVATKRAIGTSISTSADWNHLPSEVRVGLARILLESLTVTEMADVAKESTEFQSRIACGNASGAALSEVIEAAVDCGWDPDDSDLPEWLRRVEPGGYSGTLNAVVAAAIDVGWKSDQCSLPEWLRSVKADMDRISEELGIPPGWAPAPGEVRRLFDESVAKARAEERERCIAICDVLTDSLRTQLALRKSGAANDSD